MRWINNAAITCMKRFSNAVVWTLVWCTLSLLLCVFHATSATNFTAAFYAILIVKLTGFSGILLNLVLAFARGLHPRIRLLHFCLVTLIGVIILWAVPRSVERHFLGLRWSFLQRRVQDYDAMVTVIKDNRSLLTARYAEVGELVHRPSVIARTNKDETLSIRFYGRVDGSWMDHKRIGYFYHNGPMLAHTQNVNYYTLPDLQAYQYHLTNGWYEF